jgi:cell division protein FtsQ
MEDAQVLMPEQGSDILAHFGQDQFLQRYQRYKAHINEWRQQYPKLAAVDLRYDQQVVLEMSPGTDVAQAAADAQATVPSNAGSAKPLAAADTAPVKPAAKAAVKTAAKPAAKAGGNPAAPQTVHKAVVKAIHVKIKKRAELRRAALSTTRLKTAPTAPPAASAGMGQ